MGSSLNRLEIVQAAVKQAGRSTEFNSQGKLLLSSLLRHLALANKYPCLRKIGDAQTLSAGSATANLPSDFGAGVEVILFGSEKVEMAERELLDFVRAGGIPRDDAQAVRPTFFMVDKDAGKFRFNAVADAAYSFIPIYFRLPADLSSDDTDDTTKLWYEDDRAITQGLIGEIYQFTDDVREPAQKRDFERLDAKYRAGAVPKSAASQRLKLSSAAFRIRTRW